MFISSIGEIETFTRNSFVSRRAKEMFDEIEPDYFPVLLNGRSATALDAIMFYGSFNSAAEVPYGDYGGDFKKDKKAATRKLGWNANTLKKAHETLNCFLILKGISVLENMFQDSDFTYEDLLDYLVTDPNRIEGEIGTVSIVLSKAFADVYQIYAEAKFPELFINGDDDGIKTIFDAVKLKISRYQTYDSGLVPKIPFENLSRLIENFFPQFDAIIAQQCEKFNSEQPNRADPGFGTDEPGNFFG